MHEKGVNSVDEKITKEQQQYIEKLYTTPLAPLAQTKKWTKVQECCLMKKQKAI